MILVMNIDPKLKMDRRNSTGQPIQIFKAIARYLIAERDDWILIYSLDPPQKK